MSLLHRNPLPTVDIIIELEGGGIVLIERKNPPPGWAIPGGFIDAGESAEAAAVREAKEETNLDVELHYRGHRIRVQVTRDRFRLSTRTGTAGPVRVGVRDLIVELRAGAELEWPLDRATP